MIWLMTVGAQILRQELRSMVAALGMVDKRALAGDGKSNWLTNQLTAYIVSWFSGNSSADSACHHWAYDPLWYLRQSPVLHPHPLSS
jgi:hypothetical protein